jgi:hypothetical protein
VNRESQCREAHLNRSYLYQRLTDFDFPYNRDPYVPCEDLFRTRSINGLHLCSTATMDNCESPQRQASDTTNYAANKNSIQAFRRSCDRCHIQKLKCPRSTRSPAQCQRCERAGHKCVYSRRNPRQTTRRQGSASSIASPVTQEGDIQSHQPLMATGHDISLDMLSLGLLSTLDQGDIDPLPDWSWQGFTESALEGFHDLEDPTSYNPQTTLTSLSTEGEPATTACQYHDVFERLSSISKTLEDYIHFLANQWHHKDIQNCKRARCFLYPCMTWPCLIH